jgi:hypothetical protein
MMKVQMVSARSAVCGGLGGGGVVKVIVVVPW